MMLFRVCVCVCCDFILLELSLLENSLISSLGFVLVKNDKSTRMVQDKT